MTSHCSKGLEFPTVFVAGSEEGLFPLLKQDSSFFDLEEERRLYYVSITRAKDRLILTWCQRRRRYGQYEDTDRSRFIREMFPDKKKPAGPPNTPAMPDGGWMLAGKPVPIRINAY